MLVAKQKPDSKTTTAAEVDEEDEWANVSFEDLAKTIESLARMGYTDSALNTRLIHEHHNDLDKIVAAIKKLEAE